MLQPARELRHVRFRSRKKLRTRGQILSDVGRWLDDYSALEELTGVRRVFRLQGVAGETVAGQGRAVRAARIAHATVGFTADEPVRDICGLLDSAGAKVFPKPVASDGFFGLSVDPADGGPAVVVNTSACSGASGWRPTAWRWWTG